MEDVVHGDAIQKIIQSVVPEGIRVEIPDRSLLQREDTGYNETMQVFIVVYCGEYKALRRSEADEYRHLSELEVEKVLGGEGLGITLREKRRGRLVSKLFPYSLLGSIVEEHGYTKK